MRGEAGRAPERRRSGARAIRERKIVAVMPAYNAAATLERTYRDIPPDSVDEVLVVDDASRDDTVAIALALGLMPIVHPENRGYGANQKTCYDEALRRQADIVVMIHPDYQYDSRLIPLLTGFRLGDVPVPVRYMAEASSIGFRRSVSYGLGTLWTLVRYSARRLGRGDPLFVGRRRATS